MRDSEKAKMNKTKTKKIKEKRDRDNHWHKGQVQITAVTCNEGQTCLPHSRSTTEDFQKYRFLDHNIDTLNQNFPGEKVKESVFLKRRFLSLAEF